MNNQVQTRTCGHCGDDYEVIRTGLGIVNDHVCFTPEMSSWRQKLTGLEGWLAKYMASPQAVADRFHVEH